MFESDARCAVLHEDGADRTETEPMQQTLHRDVVAVGIHTQVTVLFQTPRHASGGDALAPYRTGHAVDDMVGTSVLPGAGEGMKQNVATIVPVASMAAREYPPAMSAAIRSRPG